MVNTKLLVLHLWQWQPADPRVQGQPLQPAHLSLALPVESILKKNMSQIPLYSTRDAHTRRKNSPIWQHPQRKTVIPQSFPHHPEGHLNVATKCFKLTDTMPPRRIKSSRFWLPQRVTEKPINPSAFSLRLSGHVRNCPCSVLAGCLRAETVWWDTQTPFFNHTRRITACRPTWGTFCTITRQETTIALAWDAAPPSSYGDHCFQYARCL